MRVAGDKADPNSDTCQKLFNWYVGRLQLTIAQYSLLSYTCDYKDAHKNSGV